MYNLLNFKKYKSSHFIFRGHSLHAAKSIKIGGSLLILKICCFLPIFIASFIGFQLPIYLYYVVYINNFANFFVYLWVDENFRRSFICKKTVPKSANPTDLTTC